MLALGVVFLVFLVALGASRSLNHVGGPGDLTGVRLVVGSLAVLLVGVAVIPAVLFVIWQGVRAYRAEGRVGGEIVRERRTAKGVLALALVAGVIAAFSLTRSQNNDTLTQPASQPAATVTAPDQDERSQEIAEEMLPWVAAITGACLASLLVLAWFRRRRSVLLDADVSEYELETPRRELHQQVGISIAEIEQESDPRRAVIRAYAGMESTLAGHDLGRRPFEAPGEYLNRVFAVMRLDRRPGERLTALFERARFSEHAIEPEMKRESIAALRELQSELEKEPR